MVKIALALAGIYLLVIISIALVQTRLLFPVRLAAGGDHGRRAGGDARHGDKDDPAIAILKFREFSDDVFGHACWSLPTTRLGTAVIPRPGPKAARWEIGGNGAPLRSPSWIGAREPTPHPRAAHPNPLQDRGPRRPGAPRARRAPEETRSAVAAGGVLKDPGSHPDRKETKTP